MQSFIESANTGVTDFPIQNLPYGVFRPLESQQPPRIAVAIGNQLLDVTGAVEAHLLDAAGPEACCALCARTLNQFMALGPAEWSKARAAIGSLLDAQSPTLRDDGDLRANLIHAQSAVQMLSPAEIGDYTDFYASVHHATNIGSMFRPDNPLLPNYKHLPVGYHGRASTIVISGTPITRPMGQIKPQDTSPPEFGPCRLLDYELELGCFLGPGNPLGRRIEMADAADHIFGLCIVNDWSARDVQKWEYQPLGPFNAKNFATSISPWVVTLEALAPFRIPGPPRSADDPPLLEYLTPSEPMGLDIKVELLLQSAAMREQGIEPKRLSSGGFGDMFWTFAQMLVHHTSTGCHMRPGDLIGSGTISGKTPDSYGSMLELSWRGTKPIDLPDGTQRKLLQDGDEVIIKAHCEKPGAVRIGLGECRGVVMPAV